MTTETPQAPVLRTDWTFDGCDADLQDRLRADWRVRGRILESLLGPLGGRRQRLALAVHRADRPAPEYFVRAVLRLPTGVLVAEHGEADPARALAAVADGLGREIRKHRQNLRRDHVHRFKTRHRQALNAAESFLARDVELGRRQAFFELLRPMLGFLRQHAQWELHVLRSDGTVPRGQVTVDDLMDDVLVLAWEQFRRRPAGEPLDLWVLDLLHEVAGRWAKEPPHVSLESRTAPEPERSPEDEPGEWWLGDYERVPTLEGLIPGARGGEDWDRLEAEERRARVAAALAEMPAERRQAFLLRTLENYSPPDIARVQGRPETQVRSDLAAARKFLRERLVGAEPPAGRPKAAPAGPGPD